MRVYINNAGENSLIGSFVTACMRWSDEAAGKKEIKYPEAGTQVDFEVKNIHPTVNLNQEVLTFKIAFPDYHVSIHFGNNKYDGGREI